VEALWNHLKDDKLANFALRNVSHLTKVQNLNLVLLNEDQARLQSFLTASQLQW